MSTEEEITSKISELGNAIKTAKAEKKPKEEWDPLLQEMLALKVSGINDHGFSLCFVFKIMFCRQSLRR